ncbi:polysaccharide pyruvyl transferase family protein [Cellulomonas humilata]|uniref:Polysaccharide pyruvyl transferase family protein n=1 Tax=Cellulomonas humilata TaxID=144055 RepID=A0A7Y5ZZI1_9CELL|nr:polysaccharide pyruvyl transferase family protein [Cellulomonas humilata]NUU16966.1 polysaccharide pyruvyl transferase family protein [Cellulomonas humilata]
MKLVVLSADRTLASGYAANLGDSFLTDALVQALSEEGATVEAVDFGGRRREGYGARRSVSGFSGLARTIGSADAVVIGGGTLLQDDVGGRVGGLPRLMAVTSLLGWLLRTPVVFFGVGCDPVHRRVPRSLLRAALWRRRVWARDEQSMQRCSGLGVAAASLSLGSDVSLLLADEIAAMRGGDGPNHGVVALAKADSEGLTHPAVLEAVARWGSLVFVQMFQDESVGDASTLSRPARNGFARVTDGLSWREAAAVVAGADVVIASRMHALYLALMAGTPAIPVGDLAKVRSFAREFGLSEPMEAADAMKSDPRVGDSAALDVAVARACTALRELMDVLRSSVRS